MKVLILNSNLKGIGTYRRSFYFSRELARHGHDVTMVTVSRNLKYRSRSYYKRDWIGEADQPIGEGPWVRMIEAPSVGYKWLPGWGSGPLDIGLRIKKILTESYDVVYGFEYHPNVAWPVYLTRPFLKYRFYSDWCDWHSGIGNTFKNLKFLHRIDAFFEEKIRLIARKVTTNSSLLAERAKRIGVPLECVVFVPEGCDPRYIRHVDIRVARSKLGLPLDALLVGTSADSHWRETLDIFAQVAALVPRAQLLIVGGRKKPRLKEYADKLGISIIETGWVADEDYPLYLASSDVLFFVMKESLYDLGRWPGTVSDYIATGRACVISDVGDSALFVKRHNAGYVARDAQEMAAKIVHLLSCEEERLFYGQRAREAAVNHLDWRVFGDLINQVILD